MKERLFEIGVDVDDAVRRFMGRQELFIKALKKFVNDIIANGITDIETAMTMDAEEFRKYIHGLKGVTANLSMREMNALLIEIEQSVKAGNPDFVKYEYFHGHFPVMAQQIREIILAEEGPVPAAAFIPSGSEEECRELLKKLSKYLMMGMAKECEDITITLRGKSWGNFEKDDLLRVCDAIDGYDYAKAMEMVDDIRSIKFN